MPTPAASSDGAPIGRRVVLAMLGLGALGIVTGSKVQRGLEWALAPILARDGSGLAGLLPVSRFRIYSVTGQTPLRDATTYRLVVDGMVESTLELNLADLRALPPTRLVRDFQCVTGWRVPDVPWVGVTVGDLIDRAGVQPGAVGVRFYSYDGLYTESLTMEQARRRDVLVAYDMENRAVPPIHGGPVRLYVAPMYGYKSLKWLERIEVTSQTPPVGYWANRGYDQDAWVGRSNGRRDEAT